MGPKKLREYKINIFSLENKLHELEFDISNKLFENQEYSLVEKGNGTCHLSLQKSETMMNLHFNLDVKVELTCDRSLDTFLYPISLEEDIIIKFGEDEYDLSENVFVIRKESDSINVGDFLYEFINVAIPMKKLHPRYDDDLNDDQPDLVYTSNDSADQSAEKEEMVDPRWEALKKLKD